MGYYAATLEAVLGSDDANPFISVFTYESTELLPTSVGAEALGNFFEDTLLDAGSDLRALLPTELVFQGLTIVAPQVPTVLHVRALSLAGQGVGDHDGGWSAYEWTSPRTVANIRPGFKRFGPVLKANNVDGVLAAGAATIAGNVADVFGTVYNALVSGISTNFTPVIVKRIPYTAPSGNTAYRLPNGTDAYVRSIATNWVYRRLTTQNSRKR